MGNPDINDLLLETVEASATAEEMEQFFTFKLPDDGEHLAVLRLGDRGITADRQRSKEKNSAGQMEKTGPAYLNVHLMAKILDPVTMEEGSTVFDNPTSIVMQSTGASKIHAILHSVGQSAPGSCSLGDLKQHTEIVLAQSPQIKITTQWQAQIKDSDGSYRTIAKGQKGFPPVLDSEGKPTGKYLQQVTDPKTGQVVDAQVRIVKYAKV